MGKFFKAFLPYLKAIYGAVTAFVGSIVTAYASSPSHSIGAQAWWVASSVALGSFGVIWGVPNVPNIDAGKLAAAIHALAKTTTSNTTTKASGTASGGSK